MVGQPTAAIFQHVGILEKLNFGLETYAKLTHNKFMKMMTNTTFFFNDFTAKAKQTHAAKLKAQVLSSFHQLTGMQQLGRPLK